MFEFNDHDNETGNLGDLLEGLFSNEKLDKLKQAITERNKIPKADIRTINNRMAGSSIPYAIQEDNRQFAVFNTITAKEVDEITEMFRDFFERDGNVYLLKVFRNMNLVVLAHFLPDGGVEAITSQIDGLGLFGAIQFSAWIRSQRIEEAVMCEFFNLCAEDYYSLGSNDDKGD